MNRQLINKNICPRISRIRANFTNFIFCPFSFVLNILAPLQERSISRLSIILFVVFIGMADIVSGGSEEMTNYSGYKKTISGEDFGYHSAIPGVGTSMLVRALYDQQSISWETEKIPADFSEPDITFVWLFAIDVNDNPKKFTLFINEVKSLIFENPTEAIEQEWQVQGSNATKLNFRGTMVDQHDDLHGIATLTIQRSLLSPGESINLKIVGENAKSSAWYMTFKYDFSENVRATAPAVLLNDNKRPIIVDYNYLGDPTEISVTTSQGTNFSGEIKLGVNRIIINVPEVREKESLEIELQVKNRPKIKTKIDFAPCRQMEIYVLPHSHTDIGYTELQTEVQKKHIQFIDQALEIIEATSKYPEGAKYKWNIEVSWALDSYLKSQPPEKCERVIKAIRNGDIGLEGMYNNVLSGLCRPEELLQLFAYSSEVAEKYDLSPVSSAMISDIPGQTWGLVSAMHHAGVKYFSTAPNYFDRIGTILATWEDKPFYWIGPSKNEKVLVWIPYQGYGLAHILGNKLREENIYDIMTRLTETEYPYDMTYMRWSGQGDNWGPEQHLSESIKEWNQKYKSPTIKLSTTVEVFEKFEKLYGDQIEQVRGDWTPYWEDGAASSARETAVNRSSSERLTQAEVLWALVNPQGFPKERFDTAWKNIMMYSEHTWGADISVSEPESKKTKDQWELKQAYAIQGEKQSYELINSLNCENSDNQSSRIDIYNLNSWSRGGMVSVPKELSMSGNRISDSEGNILSSQRLSGGELVFKVEMIPPYSSQRYTISEGESIAERSSLKIDEWSLENDNLKVVLDQKTGNIAAIYKKGNSENLVDLSKGEQLNQYLFLPGKDLKDIQTSGKTKITIEEKGPLISSIIVESEAPGCNLLKREIRLAEGVSHLNIINTVDKSRAKSEPKAGDYDFARKNGKEGLHFSFPLNIPQGIMRLDIPYVVMQPEVDQIPSACKNWFTVQRFIDVSNDKHGITWANLDAPMVEVGEISGNILGNLSEQRKLGYWRHTVDPAQNFYSWVMNNHWHTNYKAYQEGLVTFRYALQPHAEYDPEKVMKFAIEISQPLLVMSARKEASIESRLKLNNEAVIITALKPSKDKKALILRLYSASGKDESASIIWSEPKPIGIWLSDLSERPLSKTNEVIKVPAGSIVTLRAEMRE